MQQAKNKRPPAPLALSLIARVKASEKFTRYFYKALRREALQKRDRARSDLIGRTEERADDGDRVRTSCEHGARVIFRDAADGDVTDGQMRRGLRLCDVVRRVADDRVGAEQAARGRRVEIVLTEMHAICLQCERNVGAVVDNESRAVCACDLQRGFCFQVERARAGVFFTQLDELCAARAQVRDLLGVGETAEPCVGDGIKFG